MLLDLPAEILLAIAKQVAEKKDLKHLCEVSTYLYSIAIPILYERITVSPQDEDLLDNIDVSPFVRTRYTTRNLLSHTKNIEVASQFHTRTRNRCVHSDDWVWSPFDDSEVEHPSIGRLAANLMPLLEGCRINSLRSFTWALGTCIPREIIGCSGYLPLKQKLIESIRLITDGACDYNLNFQSPINLSDFTHLKKLSWSGLRSENDMETLQDTIKQVSHQLVELELDFINWSEVQAALFVDDDDSDTFFVRNILELPPKSTTCMFPALQILSLSGLSFESAAEEMSYAFDFGSLRSLKLRFCFGWERFLLCGSRLNRPTRLKCLEIQSAISYEESVEESVSEFLRSFHGLEQLAISTGSPAWALDIWRAALHHKSTLKAFAHHQRNINLDEDSPYFEEECDNPDLSLTLVDKEMAEWTRIPSQQPLTGLDLEFLGLCCDPELLTGLIDLIVSNSATYQSSQSEGSGEYESLELTKSLHDLAQWAFGPKGLPSLEVIVYGDFSYEGRYVHSNVFLCRNVGLHQISEQHMVYKTFRHFSRDGRRQRDLLLVRALLDKYSSTLAACPTGPLLQN
ncbi:hypothetical protein DM02DRAFT_635787 [Periconia macrospinosa]|uniref:Uncharacterized protein n=1 Tax=Periconia macrospinosa TaxID=97972 RepID=A0A2V1D1K4_9PLEO|nr:hypothetical protein DM02DRAFT_635787 [Periconia macrospinosa]